MGYELPAEVPGWKVQVYGLAISMPYIAARVGWVPSEGHSIKVFRTKAAAEAYANRVAASAIFSLIPVAFAGRITLVSRKPDILDRLRAWLGIRPYCGSFSMLYGTQPRPDPTP